MPGCSSLAAASASRRKRFRCSINDSLAASTDFLEQFVLAEVHHYAWQMAGIIDPGYRFVCGWTEPCLQNAGWAQSFRRVPEDFLPAVFADSARDLHLSAKYAKRHQNFTTRSLAPERGVKFATANPSCGGPTHSKAASQRNPSCLFVSIHGKLYLRKTDTKWRSSSSISPGCATV
jgi:hypothetical protein